MNITKSDPRLTSFVLGELTETETNEIQTAINANPELQTEIESIRQTVKEIETAMKNEPLPEKLNIIPKRNNWFRRIAVATVAVSLLVAGIVAFVGDLLPHQKVVRHLPRMESELVLVPPSKMNIPDHLDQVQLPTTDTDMGTETAKLDVVESANRENVTLQPDQSNLIESSPPPIPETAVDISQTEQSNIKSYENNEFEAAVDMPKSEQSNVRDIDSNSDIVHTSKPVSGNENLRIKKGRPLPGANANISSAGREKSGRVVSRGMGAMGNMSYKELTKNSSGQRRDRDDSYNSANAETYKHTAENEFKPVKLNEFSTFSIDVDTASYTTMRRYLNESGKRPPINSVRIEEYVNYFKYDYAPPTDGKPFATHIDISPCPWQPKHLLARIGIKGKDYSTEERPALNLVFLIDVSGSMSSSNRLPLVQRGLTELVEMLQPKDRVAIVTYAGSSRIALPSVSGQEKRAILDSINSLSTGGSTAGAAGIKTAYEVARKYYDKDAQNRVILCTDGDFNVGETNNETLETMIGNEAKSGVFLTILGFGMGNYKDERLKTLSMRGNGNYGYIDTYEESRKLLVEGLTGTLFAIAKDVKIQIDFNPVRVAGYRLIGYENRKLRDEDFNNDKIDAGEIGAGHTVTALYELVPVGEKIPMAVDQSRYDNKTPATDTDDNIPDNALKDELFSVKLRYKLPDGDKSLLLEYPVSSVSETMASDLQFASSVALFGMLLCESPHSGNGNFDSVLELATPNTNNNQYRNEFVELVKKAKNASHGTGELEIPSPPRPTRYIVPK
jgi:Ca-activated chloride channel family protein